MLDHVAWIVLPRWVWDHPMHALARCGGTTTRVGRPCARALHADARTHTRWDQRDGLPHGAAAATTKHQPMAPQGDFLGLEHDLSRAAKEGTAPLRPRAALCDAVCRSIDDAAAEDSFTTTNANAVNGASNHNNHHGGNACSNSTADCHQLRWAPLNPEWWSCSLKELWTKFGETAME